MMVILAVAVPDRRWCAGGPWRLSPGWWWRLCPLLSVIATRLLKRAVRPLQGRRTGLPERATTVVITVMAMLVLAVGVSLWPLPVAALVTVIGALSMAATDLHYLTDNIGSVFLASATVCLAVLAARLLRRFAAAARPAARPENTQPPRNVPSNDR